jgi:hypothetical protein
MSALDRSLSRRKFLAASAAVPAAALLASAAPSYGAALSTASVATRRPSGSSAAAMTFSDWWGNQFDHYLGTMKKLTGDAVSQEEGSYSVTKLFTELTAGSAPSFFLVDSHWNGTLLPNASKYLYPLDGALKTAGVDPKGWNIPPSVDNGYGGQVWGLDLFVTQDNIVFVNTEMADKDGLLKDLPLWGTASFDNWKWPQFVDFLKSATKTTSSGKVVQYAIGAGEGLPSLAFGLFQATLASMGGAQLMNNAFDYDETKSLFDSEPVIETVQMIADLYTRYKVAAPLGVDTSETPAYTTEKAMMTVWYSTPSIGGNFPMSYMHLPYVDQRVHAVGSNSFCVNKSFSDPEEAAAWIITFTTNPSIRKPFLEFSSVPAYDPLPIVATAPDSPGKTIALINLSRIPGASTEPSHTVDVARWPYWLGRWAPSQTMAALTSVPEQVILGKSTAKQACQGMASQLNAAISEARSAAGV